MSVMKVIRDQEGSIINIGEWDYQEVDEIIELEETYTEWVKSVFVDEHGVNIRRPVERVRIKPSTQSHTKNPLPDGAYECTADIVEGTDGGLYEASDPARWQLGHTKKAS